MSNKSSKRKKKLRTEPADEPPQGIGPSPLQLCLGLLMLATVGLRLHYLFLTYDQPIWWDEANYLVKAKSLALGTPDTGFWAGRPILFPILLAPFFALGWGELGIRIFIALASCLATFLVYKIGARLVHPWMGLMAAALFSFHYLTLFYTQRVMCEIPYVTLALLGLYLFISARGKLFWLVGPLVGCAVMLRYPAFAIPVSMLVYILITERKQALTRADYWITAGLAALTVAPDALLRGSEIATAVGQLEGHVTLKGTGSSFDRVLQFQNALKLFWSSMPPLVGVALFLSLLLVAWYLVTRKSQPRDLVNAHLLLLLLMLGPLVVHGIFIIHIEDRYLFFAVVPACLLVGSLVWHVLLWSPAEAKAPVAVVLSVGLLYVLSSSISYSSTTIESKLTSYAPLKAAGEWIRQQDDAGPFVSQSVAQLTYYSEQPGSEIPHSQEQFLELMNSSDHRYLVLSVFEPQP